MGLQLREVDRVLRRRERADAQFDYALTAPDRAQD
jgi:hypothetical protein